MNEVYVLGGALVVAGAYIMHLHNTVRAYKHNVKVLSFILQQVEEYLKEEADAEKERD